MRNQIKIKLSENANIYSVTMTQNINDKKQRSYFYLENKFKCLEFEEKVS